MTQQMQETRQQERQAPVWSFDRTGIVPLVEVAVRNQHVPTDDKYGSVLQETAATLLSNVATNGARVEMRRIITRDGYHRIEFALTELPLITTENDITAPQGGRHR